MEESLEFKPVGVVHSPFKTLEETPRYGRKANIESEIEIFPEFSDCLDGLQSNKSIYIFCWFHKANRETMKVVTIHDPSLGLRGVFCTRSPCRPNPIGISLVSLEKMEGLRLKVRGLDALDGTPVVDIKPFDVSLDTK